MWFIWMFWKGINESLFCAFSLCSQNFCFDPLTLHFSGNREETSWQQHLVALELAEALIGIYEQMASTINNIKANSRECKTFRTRVIHSPAVFQLCFFDSFPLISFSIPHAFLSLSFICLFVILFFSSVSFSLAYFSFWRQEEDGTSWYK